MRRPVLPSAVALLLAILARCCGGQTTDPAILPCSARPTRLSGLSSGRISILRQSDSGDYLEYPNSTSCAWLIVGGDTAASITIQFEYMSTECGADFVYVVDGLSPVAGGRLLGSFSGSTLPDVLTATSGFVAVYFTSDVSKTKAGFSLNFTVVSRASAQFSGSSLSSPTFNSSGSTGSSIRVCGSGLPVTTATWSCDVDLSSATAAGKWYGLSSSVPSASADSGRGGMSARAGHVAVWCPIAQALFVFGGSDASGDALYGDLWIYDLTTGAWEQLVASGNGSDGSAASRWPAARRGHAAAYVSGGNWFVHGGRLLGDSRSSAELWCLSTVSRRWTALPAGPFAVSGHTLTAVDDRWLYLLGGTLEDGSMSHRIHRYEASANACNGGEVGAWEEVVLTSTRWPDLAVTGHTTVYDPVTRSLLTFGGHRADTAQFLSANTDMYVLQVDLRYLSRLHTGKSGTRQLLSRAYHSATVIGPYMAVYGGTTISNDNNCMDTALHLYHMRCHRWVDPASLENLALPNGASFSKRSFSRVMLDKGRLMHSASVAYGNTLLIVGGYRGNVLGDVVAYVVPPNVAQYQAPGGVNSSTPSPQTMSNMCESYSNPGSCTLDPQCNWFQHNTSVSSCGVVTSASTQCPGVCGFLNTCTSCTLNGNPWPGSSSLRADSGCLWCVATQTCISTLAYSLDSNLCSVQGWWTGVAPVVHLASSCALDDRPPGVYMSVLKYPSNSSRPDAVFFYQSTLFATTDLQEDTAADCDSSCNPSVDNCSSCYTSLTATGYVHFPVAGGVQPWSIPYHVRVLKSTIFLYAYCSATQPRLLYSLNDTSTTQVDSDAPPLAKVCGNTVVQSAGQQRWRFLLQGAYLSIDETTALWSISLLWNPSTDRSYGFTELTYPYLEAFTSENCQVHDTCLACVSDMNCGWCSLTNTCLNRTAAAIGPASACGGSTPASWLTTVPGNCVLCEQRFDCSSCASSRYCEWLPSKLLCIRRGRFSNSIRYPSGCPPTCRARRSCTDCLSPRDQCVWCSSAVGCVSQLELQTTYLLGQCRNWIENFANKGSPANKCSPCSPSQTCSACLGGSSSSGGSGLGLTHSSGGFCGWCYDAVDPTHGVCTVGDYGGPVSVGLSSGASSAGQSCKAVQSTMPGLLNSTSLASASTATDQAAHWAFAECPDVDECRLHYDNCSRNATCTNTPTSFTCSCNDGFEGDGYTCRRTCYPTCVHGSCNGSPDYVCSCDLGWFGGDCSQDCGCSNLSSCARGPGLCDACQLGSVGARCEACPARTVRLRWPSAGCAPCVCNGHGDDALNLCNNITGVCYCLHNTAGDHCQSCADGYFGDPRNGSWCYPGYDGQTLLTNLTGSGTIGTVLSRKLFVLTDTTGMGGSMYDYTWLLTTFPDVDTALSAATNTSTAIILEVTDVLTDCNLDHIYVYDNVSAFMHMVTSRSDDFDGSTYLTSLCGDSQQAIQRVMSRTGFLGIYYRQPLGSPNSRIGHRFFARYTVLPVASADTAPPALSLAQSAVTCDEGQTIYVVGALPATVVDGLSAPHFLWQYNVSASSWHTLGGRGNLTGKRYYHRAAACIGNMIYLHGGLRSLVGAVGKLSSAVAADSGMLAYDVNVHKWHPVVAPGAPTVAGHTMTAISGGRLLIVGGYNPRSSWNPYIYVLTPSLSANAAEPIRIAVTRQETFGPPPSSVVFHTAVFSAVSGKLYVHGGFQYNAYSSSANYYDGSVSASASLYALHIGLWQWSLLPPAPSATGSLLPFSRYLHTAVDLAGQYMLVLGGMANSTTYVPNAMLYDYTCNTWAPFHAADKDIIVPAIRQGVVLRPDTSIAVITAIDQNVIIDCVSPLCSVNATVSTQLGQGRCSGPAFPPCSERLSCPFCQQQISSADGVAWDCVWSVEAHGRCIAVKHNSNASRSCVNDSCRLGSCSSCLNATTNCSWTTILRLQNDTDAEVEPVVPTGSCISTVLGRVITRNLTDLQGRLYVASCPPQCSDYHNASACLAATEDDEGGPHLSCTWSLSSQACLSPARALLLCNQGQCGSVVTSSVNATACGAFNRSCEACLNRPAVAGFGKCAWVLPASFPDAHGYCAAVTSDIVANQVSGVTVWHLECPPVNPCSDPAMNVCNATTEKCMRTAGSQYRCDCAAGYVIQKPSDPSYNASCIQRQPWHSLYGACVPTCSGVTVSSSSGCAPGRGCCQSPNTCRCKFGYVGVNCAIECACNGHSECTVEEPKICLNCTHFTQGDSCERCLPHYVGDPKNGGRCWSCWSLCNNFSDACTLPKASSDNPPGNVSCLNCLNNTTGPTCASCKPGYFRHTSAGPCKRCLCNGHGTDCVSSTGECVCQNNTVSLKSLQPWLNQCAACAQGYEGSPTNNRQCYATTIADTGSDHRIYCLSPKGLVICSGSATSASFSGSPSVTSDSLSNGLSSVFDSSSTQSTSPSVQQLPQGQAIFFEAAPRFFNIDLRLVMDIVNGSIDALFTTNYSTFAVKYNATTNEHVVYVGDLPEPFLAAAAAATTPKPMARFRRQASGGAGQQYFNASTATAKSASASAAAQARSYSSSYDGLVGLTGDGGSTCFDLSGTGPAVSLPLTLSSEYPNGYTVVRNLSRRLVLTLSHDGYNFKNTKVYAIVIARGLGKATTGFVSLRQDQVEINLFVFFAVFFAFVFKALSLAAIALKLRQLRAIRRRQLQRQGELTQMASRPFACVIAQVVDTDCSAEEEEAADCKQPLLTSPSSSGGGTSRNGGGVDTLGQQPLVRQAAKPPRTFQVLPLSVEPLASGSCAVATVLVRLPGNACAPVRGCLGSVLVAVKGPIAAMAIAPHAPQPKAGKQRSRPPARASEQPRRQQSQGRRGGGHTQAGGRQAQRVAAGPARAQSGAANRGGRQQQQPRGQGRARDQGQTSHSQQQQQQQRNVQHVLPTRRGGGGAVSQQPAARPLRLPPGIAESSA